MKREKMAELLGNIDDDLIEEGRALLISHAKPRRTHRAVWAVGIAAVLVLSLSIGAAATGLFGGIFRQINGVGSKNIMETGQSVESLSVSLDDVSVLAPANGDGELPVTVSVKEAYYDGVFLYAGMEMVLGVDDDVDVLENLMEGKSVRFNDTEMIGTGTDGHDHDGFAWLYMLQDRWERKEDGHFISRQAYLVPEELQDQEILNVDLGFCGIAFPGHADNLPTQTINSSPFSLSFSVEKNNAYRSVIEGNGLEMGQVELIKAMATPAGCFVTVDYHVKPMATLRFEDGETVNVIGETGDVLQENGSVRFTKVFGGLKEDELRKVIWDGKINDQENTEAVFVFDFASETARAGSTDEIEKELFIARYHSPWPVIDQSGATHKIEYAYYEPHNDSIGFEISTRDEEYRELRLEIVQDGQTLSSAVSTERENPGFDQGFYGAFYFDRDSDGLNSVELEHVWHEYTLPVFSLWDLDIQRPMTCLLYDNATGNLLMEETIVFDEFEYR